MDKDSERRVESKMKKVFFCLDEKKVRKALGHTSNVRYIAFSLNLNPW